MHKRTLDGSSFQICVKRDGRDTTNLILTLEKQLEFEWSEDRISKIVSSEIFFRCEASLWVGVSVSQSVVSVRSVTVLKSFNIKM